MVEGRIANFGISLDIFLSFCILDDFFRKKREGFLGILDPPYCGIGATIRIGREMLCLPYAGFLYLCWTKVSTSVQNPGEYSEWYWSKYIVTYSLVYTT